MVVQKRERYSYAILKIEGYRFKQQIHLTMMTVVNNYSELASLHLNK